MTVVKSIFDSLRPRKYVPPTEEEMAEQKLDAALERLAEAMRVNAEMSERVRRRQSSGKLKLKLVSE